MDAEHTPGFLYVGNQNDYPYIIDRKPALSNDHSHHDADCEMVAKPFAARGATAQANARRLVACWNVFDGIDTESIEEGDRTTSVRLMHQIRELRIQRNHFEALAKDNGRTIIQIACELADVKAQRDVLIAAIGNDCLEKFIEKHGQPIPIVAQRDALLKGLKDMVHIYGPCDTATDALNVIANATVVQS